MERQAHHGTDADSQSATRPYLNPQVLGLMSMGLLPFSKTRQRGDGHLGSERSPTTPCLVLLQRDSQDQGRSDSIIYDVVDLNAPFCFSLPLPQQHAAAQFLAQFLFKRIGAMRLFSVNIIFTSLFIIKTFVCGEWSIQDAAVGMEAAPELLQGGNGQRVAPQSCTNDSAKGQEWRDDLSQGMRRMSFPVEVSGDRLSLEWGAGDDLWAKAREFRHAHMLMAPPDCAGKKTLAELEFCTDDHLVMFMQREMMTR